MAIGEKCRLDVQKNAVVDDLHFVNLHSGTGWWAQVGAADYVKAGPVPGARYFMTHKVAFPERSAAMGAGIINGVKTAGTIEQGQCAPTGHYLFTMSRRHFRNSCHFRQGHCHVSWG
jgi:hypothetical protein